MFSSDVYLHLYKIIKTIAKNAIVVALSECDGQNDNGKDLQSEKRENIVSTNGNF